MATQACLGRGSASRMALLLCLGCALWCSTASAATLMVGGSKGWTTAGVNYTAWAANETFATGDTLFFPYAVGTHDVAVVSQANYTACTNTSNDKVDAGGNTNVTIPAGSSYYICTFPGHCLAGMKLAVTTGGSSPASTPSSPTSGTNGTSNSTGSSAVPSVTTSQLGYFVAIFSALLAGFIL